MICYFDTSAFIPILIAEPGSPACEQLWNDADAVVTSQLTYVEAAAGLAQAARMDRVDEAAHTQSLQLLDQLWMEFQLIDVDEPLVRRAAEVAHSAALRGYDAIHCASAEQILDTDLLVASGDQKLLGACRTLGMVTSDINAP